MAFTRGLPLRKLQPPEVLFVVRRDFGVAAQAAHIRSKNLSASVGDAYDISTQKKAYGIPVDRAATHANTTGMVWGPGTFGYSPAALALFKSQQCQGINLDKVKVDDPVGAISVHGTCGIFGLLVVPIANPDASLMSQLAGIGAIGGFVFVFSLIVWAVLRMTMGIRVNPDDERAGLDFAECGMEAYPDFAHGGD